MTTGSPDYGITAGQVNEPQSADLLELAARLGSIKSVNRSGQQIISIGEAITYGGCFQYVDSYGGYLLPSNKYSYYNRPSLKCITGANANGFAGIVYNHVAFGGNPVGIEAFVISNTFGATLLISFTSNNQITYCSPAIKIDLSTGNLSTYNAALGWDAIGTYNVPSGYGMPYSIKFTFDQTTGKYGKLFYNSEMEVNLNTHSMPMSAPSGADTTLYNVYIANNSAVSNTIYLQDVITTINEVI
jgi:hypothetical protein